jgi:hypothetical protein
MMVCVVVQGDQMSYIVDGTDAATAAKMLTAAAQAITERIATETAAAPPARPAAPRPHLYLPNGHGHIPPIQPPGQ